MTKEILYTGTVKSITELIVQWKLPLEAFLLVERIPQQLVTDRERRNLLRFAHLKDRVVEDKADGDKIDIALYSSGRIFDNDFELRWEKEGEESYRVVYIGRTPETEIPGLKKDDETLKKLKKRDKSQPYYLFGEYLDAGTLREMRIEPREGYYAEVRIPRLLEYPAPPKAQRVQLYVCEYIDEDTGQVKLFRFQGLRNAEEKA